MKSLSVPRDRLRKLSEKLSRQDDRVQVGYYGEDNCTPWLETYRAYLSFLLNNYLLDDPVPPTTEGYQAGALIASGPGFRNILLLPVTGDKNLILCYRKSQSADSDFTGTQKRNRPGTAAFFQLHGRWYMRLWFRVVLIDEIMWRLGRSRGPFNPSVIGGWVEDYEATRRLLTKFLPSVTQVVMKISS